MYGTNNDQNPQSQVCLVPNLRILFILSILSPLDLLTVVPRRTHTFMVLTILRNCSSADSRSSSISRVMTCGADTLGGGHPRESEFCQGI